MSTTRRGVFSALDMTQGSALYNLVMFSIPLLIGNIFQQLYNTVDALVVGQAMGSGALASVGASGQIIFFFISLFIGVSVGAGVMISQAFGAKDTELLKKTVSTLYGLSLYIGVILMVAGFFLSKPILVLMKTPPEILDDSVAYLRIIFIGMLASAAYNGIGGVLRAVGDSITPLIFLVIATVLNIVLDILFVVAFGWGVPGVAFATIIAQGVSAVLSIIRLNQLDDAIHLKRGRFKIYRDILPGILRIGLPSGISNISISLGSMVIQGLINSLGVVVVAGYTSFLRIDTFTTMPMMNISMAVTTFVGQNIGARRLDRVKQGVKVSIVLVTVVAAVMSALSLLFARPLLGLFTPGEFDVIDAGMTILWRVAPFYFLLGCMFCIGGVMRGAGEARVPMIASILSVCVIRVPLAYILYAVFQTPSSIWWAIPIGWVIGFTLQAIYYNVANWRERAINRMRSIATEPEAGPVETEM